MVKKLRLLTLVISILALIYFLDLFKQPAVLDSVLRLHVIANSDSLADQNLKLAVKDAVVKYMQEQFTTVEDINSAKELAEKNRDYIQAVAEAEVARQGYAYPVRVEIGRFDFPLKSYGNLIFPPGSYDAVRVIIGEGQGRNWWCVLFPPLCLVSSSDKGLSLDSPREAKISFKCLELLSGETKKFDGDSLK